MPEDGVNPVPPATVRYLLAAPAMYVGSGAVATGRMEGEDLWRRRRSLVEDLRAFRGSEGEDAFGQVDVDAQVV